MLWEDHKITITPSAIAIETMPPLPRPPASKFLNNVACCTVSANPTLFKIVTLINILCFESLLSSHPNQPLVDSVLLGFQASFWPFADTSFDGFPNTWDESMPQHNISPNAIRKNGLTAFWPHSHLLMNHYFLACIVCLCTQSQNQIL